MQYGDPTSVRSHRRAEITLRRITIAPMGLLIVVAVVLLAAIFTGYWYLARPTCSGTVRARIVAAASMTPLLTTAAARWQETNPSVNGVCAAVEIDSKDSSLMAQSMGATWDAKSLGAAPDVWVPESSAW